MKLDARWIKRGLLLATGTVGLALAVQNGAQVQTTKNDNGGREQPDRQGQPWRSLRGGR